MLAAATLRTEPNFVLVRAAIGEIAFAKVQASLDTPVEQRVEATAYARALRDLWVTLEGAALQVRPTAVVLPKTAKARGLVLGAMDELTGAST